MSHSVPQKCLQSPESTATHAGQFLCVLSQPSCPQLFSVGRVVPWVGSSPSTVGTFVFEDTSLGIQKVSSHLLSITYSDEMDT